jgi:O-antigen ligase
MFIIFLATVPLAEVPHLHIPAIPFFTVNKLLFLFLLIAWLPNRLRQGIHWFANSHIQVVGCFLLCVFGSLMTGTHRLNGIEALPRIIGMGLLFIIAMDFLSKPTWLTRTFWVLWYEFALLSLISLAQVIRGRPIFELGVAAEHGYHSELILMKSGIVRAGGTFDNPNHFGFYLAILIVAGICMLMFSHPKRLSPLTVVGFLLISAGAFFTFSFSVLLSIFLALTVLFLPRIKESSRMRWLWISVLIVIPLVAILRFLGPELSTRHQFTSYTQERLEATRVALRVINDYPIFGSGLNTYTFLFVKYKNPALFFKSVNLELHNTFLEIWTELGLLGLLCFLILFGLGLKNLLDPPVSSRAKALLGAMIIAVVFCLFHPVLYWEVIWLILAAAAAYQSDGVDKSQELRLNYEKENSRVFQFIS